MLMHQKQLYSALKKFVTIKYHDDSKIFYDNTILSKFLNQVHAWFLKIDPVRIVGMRVCVCVCVSAPEAINN